MNDALEQTKQRIRGMNDAELKHEIYRLFSDWCWVSGEPGQKDYYAWLLEEAERREGTRKEPS